MWSDIVSFDTLQGRVLEDILIDRSDGRRRPDEVLYFVTDKGVFRMLHEQDCCEYVSIEDVAGDPRDLCGALVVTAEESVSDNDVTRGEESVTWTFYRIVTSKGDLTIRWYGSSNGYYSESVSFERHEGPVPSSAVPFVWEEE